MSTKLGNMQVVVGKLRQELTQLRQEQAWRLAYVRNLEDLLRDCCPRDAEDWLEHAAQEAVKMVGDEWKKEEAEPGSG